MTDIRARSLTFGPRRPDGESGTFSYNAARFDSNSVQFMVEMYGSDWTTRASNPLRTVNICRAAYWRAVADAQARR